MLKKETMVLNASTTAPFTHIVNVGTNNHTQLFGYSNSSKIGNIHPKTINIGDTKFNVLQVSSFELALQEARYAK